MILSEIEVLQNRLQDLHEAVVSDLKNVLERITELEKQVALLNILLTEKVHGANSERNEERQAGSALFQDT